MSEDVIITGNRAIARSYAKINLTLDVLGRREDGYHDVSMIMQKVSLFDLVITDKSKSDIEISTNLRFLPNNEKNIAYLAAKEFFKFTGIKGGARIIIHKNIPVAAGLAGGSGNAAAVLRSLDKLYNTDLSQETLCNLGLRLGSDVPYCIIGGTALATGVGEKLEPISGMPKCTILMVKPKFSVSTKAIYEAIDSTEITDRPDTQAMIRAINSGDTVAIAAQLSNVMGTVTEKLHPMVGGIRKKMMMNGARVRRCSEYSPITRPPKDLMTALHTSSRKFSL